MKRGGLIFVVGLAAGVAVRHRWRKLAKESIKAGVRATRAIREVSEEAMEELEDIAAEAMAEVDADEQRTADAHAPAESNGRNASN